MKNNQKDRPEHSKLVIDGNAFYELDLDCVRRREERRKGHPEDREKEQKKK